MIMLTIKSESERVTRELGAKFAKILKPGMTVLLHGDLGTGKTVFTRGICEALGAANCKSPSFTLINEYKANNNLIIAHADLYRLNTQAEIDALGLDDYIDAPDCVLIAEWPERNNFWPSKNLIKIYFAALSESQREIKFDSDLNLDKILNSN
ncbi:MAG: tRNA (adenosine(37)-N6)-threonylcarbamoyltransferase complex ATPase subunit type 1 TsaE [Synergistaceae bacterium]|nr:tRNA (adenosine(37)-N6)-threonylcarbamoyltransferase complex ATPase subunit type 1 TsaE [Synergistaceae bacterium]